MQPTPVNLQKLKAVFDAQVLQGIRYKLGGKAPSLSAKPSQLEGGIDCSGEVRLLLFQATDGSLTIPDGSWNQREYCEQHFEEVPYSRALAAKEGELFIAFITAGVKGAGKVGHVWFVTQRDSDAMAETIESYGGRGIGSRPASYGTLVRLVHKCFEIPTTSTHPVAVVPESDPDRFPHYRVAIDGVPTAIDAILVDTGVENKIYIEARELVESQGGTIAVMGSTVVIETKEE